MDVVTVMESFRNQIQAFPEAKVVEHGPFKMKFSVFANWSKPIDETKVSCHANSYTKPILFLLTVNDYLEMVDQIVSTLQVFCSTGSGFIIESLEHLISISTSTNRFVEAVIIQLLQISITIIFVEHPEQTRQFMFCVLSSGRVKSLLKS